ncbi:MAG TPA: serine/threonine-protein kinase [Crinalium sp.]
MADPNIGRILSNRYQLEDLLGQGSMGRVYGAKDMLLGGVPVAAKFLSQTLLNQRMRDRFEREATTCALLGQRSIHVVRVTDYGVDEDEIPYYIMEYLKGENLTEVINHQPMALPRFLSLSRQICLGLQCAHQGIPINGEVYPIIHRDIKPSNILVIQDHSLGELAKILDFGIAKVLQEDSQQTNCFMGTLAYSSPEQMEGHELDGRSDIYSLGVMMFQMLTGKMPLQADTHSFGGWYKAHHHQSPRSFESINASIKIPKDLENLVMSCLSKSPSDRPQSVAEILKAFVALDQKYRPGWELGQQIREKLHPSPPSIPSPSEIHKFAQWPKNKPIADIVFPYPIRTTQGLLMTLWVMLSKREIENRQICTRYNQFLFLPSPHPTILWLTVLFNRDHGPRWLPVYLDLQSSQGQQMARLLGEAGEYRLLFFAQEAPLRCANEMTSKIAPAQCKMLLEWATTAQMSPPTKQFALSKKQLQGELERLKPRIMMQLESIYSDSGRERK